MQFKDEHVIYLHMPTNSPAIGHGVLPEQRIKFAKDFEKQFHDKGMDATVTTNGDQQNIITITGKVVNEPSVHRMKESVDAIQDLRENGFKHLVMNNGNECWDIDSKN